MRKQQTESQQPAGDHQVEEGRVMVMWGYSRECTKHWVQKSKTADGWFCSQIVTEHQTDEFI
jgi:hypothetical protein